MRGARKLRDLTYKLELDYQQGVMADRVKKWGNRGFYVICAAMTAHILLCTMVYVWMVSDDNNKTDRSFSWTTKWPWAVPVGAVVLACGCVLGCRPSETPQHKTDIIGRFRPAIDMFASMPPCEAVPDAADIGAGAGAGANVRRSDTGAGVSAGSEPRAAGGGGGGGGTGTGTGTGAGTGAGAGAGAGEAGGGTCEGASGDAPETAVPVSIAPSLGKEASMSGVCMDHNRETLNKQFWDRERILHSIQHAGTFYWASLNVFFCLSSMKYCDLAADHTVGPWVVWLTLSGSLVVLAMLLEFTKFLASPLEKCGPTPVAAPWEFLQPIHDTNYSRVIVTFMDTLEFVRLLFRPEVSDIHWPIRVVAAIQFITPLVTASPIILKTGYFFRGTALLWFDVPLLIFRFWAWMLCNDSLNPAFFLKNLYYIGYAIVNECCLRPDQSKEHRKRYIEKGLGMAFDKVFVPRQ